MKDQVDDINNSELMQLNHDLPLPEFVKQASVVSSEDISSMDSSNFADVRNKKFPICSKADTWLSAAYFQKRAADNADDAAVGARLRDACSLWGVDWDSVSPMQYKQASEVEPAGVVRYEDEDGTCLHKTAYYSGGDLAKIASDLLDNPGKYNYAIRKSVSRQLLAKRASFSPSSATISSLQKSAGYGTGTLESCLHAISVRTAALPKTNHDSVREGLQAFQKEACEQSKGGYLSPEFLDKTASVLDHLDNTYGFSSRHYGKSMDYPERELFGLSLSEVDGYNKGLVKMANGRTLLGGRLGYRDMADFLSAAFGKEAKTKEQVKDQMEKLSSTQADLLCRYVDKVAMEEQVLADPTAESLLPVSQEELEDGEKEGGEEGLMNWPEDESTPREEVNEDSTPRK